MYYDTWFPDEAPASFIPVLNIHWALRILGGAMVLPRLWWRLVNIAPEEEPGSALEHRLAHGAHWGLYALMIVMRLTRYVGTNGATDFGFFPVPSFQETAIFKQFTALTGIGWERFEPPVDVVHHFVGKWVAWAVVGAHIAAALFHHFVRRDRVLLRMLPAFLDRGRTEEA